MGAKVHDAIGGSLGSLVGRALNVTTRERRILLVAGTAAGWQRSSERRSARALGGRGTASRRLRVRALVPGLAQRRVVFGVHLLLRGIDAFCALGALPFRAGPPSPVRAHGRPRLDRGQRLSRQPARRTAFYQATGWSSRRVPSWATPGIGGMALGLFATPIIMMMGRASGNRGSGSAYWVEAAEPPGGHTGCAFVPRRLARSRAVASSRRR